MSGYKVSMTLPSTCSMSVTTFIFQEVQAACVDLILLASCIVSSDSTVAECSAKVHDAMLRI